MRVVFLMKMSRLKNSCAKIAAMTAIMATPLVSSADELAVGASGASGATRPTVQRASQEEFVPESPTIIAGVLLLAPLGASALRILLRNRAAKRRSDSRP